MLVGGAIAVSIGAIALSFPLLGRAEPRTPPIESAQNNENEASPSFESASSRSSVLPSHGHAPTVTMHGSATLSVVEHETRRPVAGVCVKLRSKTSNFEVEGFTDDDGAAKFSNLDLSEYSVTLPSGEWVMTSPTSGLAEQPTDRVAVIELARVHVASVRLKGDEVSTFHHHVEGGWMNASVSTQLERIRKHLVDRWKTPLVAVRCKATRARTAIAHWEVQGARSGWETIQLQMSPLTQRYQPEIWDLTGRAKAGNGTLRIDWPDHLREAIKGMPMRLLGGDCMPPKSITELSPLDEIELLPGLYRIDTRDKVLNAAISNRFVLIAESKRLEHTIVLNHEPIPVEFVLCSGDERLTPPPKTARILLRKDGRTTNNRFLKSRSRVRVWSRVGHFQFTVIAAGFHPQEGVVNVDASTESVPVSLRTRTD